MTGCYVSNHIDVMGSVEDLEKFKNEITPDDFNYVEADENTEYIVDTREDGSVIVSVTVLESNAFGIMEKLGEKFPTLDFYLHWTDIHGSIYGYMSVEKGEVVFEEMLFSEYICCNCCDYNEDCECVFEPLVFSELSEAERPF